MPTADLVAVSVLGLAALRGVWLGLVRETFSLASLAAACVAVSFGAAPGGEWLKANAGLELDPRVAAVLAGIGITVAVLVAGSMLGRLVKSSARAVGLAWLDRGAGGVLGAAEGALVVTLALILTSVALGRDHPYLEESQAYDAVEQLQEAARKGPNALPHVGAPPPRMD
jgi:uncharacterized membrane protein required for colicin V production